jgi:hypothetical protein
VTCNRRCKFPGDRGRTSALPARTFSNTDAATSAQVVDLIRKAPQKAAGAPDLLPTTGVATKANLERKPVARPITPCPGQHPPFALHSMSRALGPCSPDTMSTDLDLKA